MSTTRDEVRIEAGEATLAATRFAPAGEPRRLVLVGTAMGTHRGYYDAFAAHLAEQGAVAVTWDFRGMGESRATSLRRTRASLTEWAEQDLPAVAEWLRAQYPGLPLGLVGHSISGHVLGGAPEVEQFQAVAAVTCGSGHWRHQRGLQRLPLLLLWYGLVPTLTPLLGYFPTRRLLGWSLDLPRGVIGQWSRWCRDRRYAASEPGWSEGFARYTGPLLQLSFTDDTLIVRSAIDDFLGNFTQARRTARHVDPSEVGLTRIGHFGFYRASSAAAWPLVSDWLAEQLDAA